MAETIDRSKEVKAVVENLNPAQKAVVFKLLNTFRLVANVKVGLPKETKVRLCDGGIKIDGLKAGASGRQKPYSLTVELELGHLVDVTAEDFAVLFGDALAETLTCEGATVDKGVESVPDGQVSDGTVEVLAGGVSKGVEKCLPELDPALGHGGSSREEFTGGLPWMKMQHK